MFIITLRVLLIGLLAVWYCKPFITNSLFAFGSTHVFTVKESYLIPKLLPLSTGVNFSLNTLVAPSESFI